MNKETEKEVQLKYLRSLIYLNIPNINVLKKIKNIRSAIYYLYIKFRTSQMRGYNPFYSPSLDWICYGDSMIHIGSDIVDGFYQGFDEGFEFGNLIKDEEVKLKGL